MYVYQYVEYNMIYELDVLRLNSIVILKQYYLVDSNVK